jgi:hypothetical protein
MRQTFEYVRREWTGDGWLLDASGYGPYLSGILQDLPPAARAFVVADWHYDVSDHRCLHDAWVDSVSINERAQGERRQHRRTEIVVKLFGAFHDGHAQLHYTGVKACSFECEDASHGHGDWIIDEVRLSPAKTIIHEVLLTKARWVIECADIEWRWTELQGNL